MDLPAWQSLTKLPLVAFIKTHGAPVGTRNNHTLKLQSTVNPVESLNLVKSHYMFCLGIASC